MTLNEILQAIIDGKQLQTFYYKTWEDVPHLGILHKLGSSNTALSCFRIKPATVSINGFEVPAPLKEPVALGVYYWVEATCTETFTTKNLSSGSNFGKLVVERGIAHATKEGAIMSCKARLGINPHKEN